MIPLVFTGMNWSRQIETVAKVKSFIFNDTNYFEHKCFNYLKQAINKLNFKKSSITIKLSSIQILFFLKDISHKTF